MIDYKVEFLAYLRDVKNSSDNTLESYVRDILGLTAFLEEEGCDNAARMTAKDIGTYILSLKAAGRSDSTVTRFTASLRCYCQFLNMIGVMQDNPSKEIKAEKAAKKMPQILTLAEVTALLNAPNADDPKGCRDKAMLELIYATGMRVTELLDLNISDFDIKNGVISCRNNRASREIPVHDTASKLINQYMSRVRSFIVTDAQNPALFVNLSGERLTRQGFWKIIKFYAKQAQILTSITPHTLRHSFAAHLLENGAAIKDIKEMMGHSDISSTQVYVQLRKNKFKDSYNKYHPRANY